MGDAPGVSGFGGNPLMAALGNNPDPESAAKFQWWLRNGGAGPGQPGQPGQPGPPGQAQPQIAVPPGPNIVVGRGAAMGPEQAQQSGGMLPPMQMGGIQLPLPGGGSRELVNNYDAKTGKPFVQEFQRLNRAAPVGAENSPLAQMPDPRAYLQAQADKAMTPPLAGGAAPAAAQMAMSQAVQPLLPKSPEDMAQGRALEMQRLVNQGHMDVERTRLSALKASELAKINADRLAKNLPPLSAEVQQGFTDMLDFNRDQQIDHRGGAITVPPGPKVEVQGAPGAQTKQPTTDEQQKLAVKKVQKSQLRDADISRIVGDATGSGNFDVDRMLGSAAPAENLGPEDYQSILMQIQGAKGGPNRKQLQDDLVRSMIKYHREAFGDPVPAYGAKDREAGYQAQVGPYTLQNQVRSGQLGTSMRVLGPGGESLGGFSEAGIPGLQFLHGTGDLLPTFRQSRINDYTARRDKASALLQALQQFGR